MFDAWWNSSTDAPIVSGTEATDSKTIMRAASVVASATSDEGGQSTEPMLRWAMAAADRPVRYRVAFDPAAAHGAGASSTSMAVT